MTILGQDGPNAVRNGVAAVLLPPGAAGVIQSQEASVIWAMSCSGCSRTP